MTNQRYRNTYIDGCSHFCTASITGFLPILVDDQIRGILVSSWQRYRKRFMVLIEGFVIMPEHVHLVLRGSGDNVRKFMQYSLAQSSREIRELLEDRSAKGNTKAKNHLAFLKSRANGKSQCKVWKE